MLTPLILSLSSTQPTPQEHAFFFKSIEDAAKLRRHVSECFERAALPQTLPEERERLLSFVVCGGGPTGVEVAAELHDMINDDLVKVYPGKGRSGGVEMEREKNRERERESRTFFFFFITSFPF